MSSPASRSRPLRTGSFAASIVAFLVLLQLIRYWPSLVGWATAQSGPDGTEHLRGAAQTFAKRSDQLLLGLRVVLWLIGTFLANSLINRFFWDGVVKRSLGRPVPGVLKDLGTVFVYVIAAACIAAAVFNQSITGFIATLGAGGVVLGFALRGLLSDIFTGLAVNFDNNFAIGDWISVPSSQGDGGTVGQVDEISWRCTRLTCEDGTTVVVPNSIMGEEKVINLSRPSVWTRYQVDITVDYSVPVERVRQILLSALQAVTVQEGFSKDQSPKVFVSKTGKRGVQYLLRYWIHPWGPHSPTTSRDMVLTAALQHLQTAGITPAYTKEEVFYEPLPAKHFQGHTIEDKVALLSRLMLFERLEEDELRSLATEMRRLQFFAGEEVFHRNDPGNSLFILIEGLLNVQIDLTGSGKEETVGQLTPGEFFGEMSLLTGDPRSATIVARSNTVVYEIHQSTIIGLIEKRQEVSECLSRAVALRQMKLEQARAKIADSDAAAKVQSITRQLMTRMKGFFQNRDAR